VILADEVVAQATDASELPEQPLLFSALETLKRWPQYVVAMSAPAANVADGGSRCKGARDQT
jgi:hypothetical protein